MAFKQARPAPTGLQLMEAVETNNFELVRVLVRSGADIDTRGLHGETPLIKSMMCEDPRICRFLLDAGANVSIATQNGYAPLSFAALQNNFEYVRTLLLHGASPNQKTSDGWTPLLIASTNSSIFYDNTDQVFFKRLVEIVYKYSKYHPDYNPLRIVTMLLSSGADPNEPNIFGTTPLMAAAGMGNSGIMSQLLESHAAIDSRDSEGKTALMYAVIGSIEEFIDSQIHLRLVSSAIRMTDFLTPALIGDLRQYFEPKKEQCVHLLIENGARVQMKDNRGISVLMHAARTGNLAVVKTLIANGADIHEKSSRGVTALYAAALNGHADIVEFLLRQGVDIECALNDGETPLMAAVWNGQVGTVDLLLRMGASVKARKIIPYKPSGDPGLIWAAHRHQNEMDEKYDLIFRMLADAGAE